MPNGNKSQQYYDYLKGQGANVPDTYEKFTTVLQDDGKRQKFYEYVKGAGYNAPESYDTFSSVLLGKKKASGEGQPTTSGASGSGAQSTGLQFEWSADKGPEVKLETPVETMEPTAVINITKQNELADKNSQIRYNSAKNYIDGQFIGKNVNYYSLSPEEIDASMQDVNSFIETRYGETLSEGQQQQLKDQWRNNSKPLVAAQFYQNNQEFLPTETLDKVLGVKKTTGELSKDKLIDDQARYVTENLFSPEQSKLYSLLKSETPESKEVVDLIKKLKPGQYELFDPVTGQYTDEVTKDAAAFEADVEAKMGEYTKTPRDQWEELFLTNSGVYRQLESDYNELLATKPEGIVGTPEYFESIDRLNNYRDIAKDKLIDARKDLEAISRMYLLNEDPAYVETGIVERFVGGLREGVENTTILDAIGVDELIGVLEGDGLLPTKFQKVAEVQANLNNIDLTDQQKEEFKDTFGEKLTDIAAQSVPIAAEIALIAATTKGIGNATGITGMAESFYAGLGARYGKYVEGGARLIGNVATQGLTFEVAGAGGTTGVGEALGEAGATALFKPLFGKYNNLADALIKGTGGNIGEFFAEYSGDFLNNLSETGDFEEAISLTAGDDPVEKALLTLSMTTMFSAGANVNNILTAGKEWLQTVDKKKYPDAAKVEEQIDQVLSQQTEGGTDAVQIEETTSEVLRPEETGESSGVELQGMEQQDQSEVITDTGAQQEEIVTETVEETTTEPPMQDDVSEEVVVSQDVPEVTEESPKPEADATQADETQTSEGREGLLKEGGGVVVTPAIKLGETVKFEKKADGTYSMVNTDTEAPVSNKTKRKHKDKAIEHIASTSMMTLDKGEFQSVEEYLEKVDDDSDSPIDIVMAWEESKSIKPEFNPVETAIADVVFGSGVNEASFDQNLDPNWRTKGVENTYIKKNGLSIDKIAMAASDTAKTKITQEQIIEWLSNNVREGVTQKQYYSTNSRTKGLAQRFKEITGFELNEETSEQLLSAYIQNQYQMSAEELADLVEQKRNEDEAREQYENALAGIETTQQTTATDAGGRDTTEETRETGAETSEQKIERLKSEAKAKLKAAFDTRKTIGVSPFSQTEAQAKADREAFDALVELAKAYIQAGVKKATDFIKELGADVNTTLARYAYEVADGKIPANNERVNKLISKAVEAKKTGAAKKGTEYAEIRDKIREYAAGVREGIREGSRKQKEVAEQVKEYINSLTDKGTLTAKQAKSLLKRAAQVNFRSPRATEKFLSYVEKVFSDAEYAEKVNNANELISKAKKKSRQKSVAPNHRQVLAMFAEVDPTEVDDIDAFNDILETYMRNFLAPTNQNYLPANSDEMYAYAEYFLSQNMDATERLLEDYGIEEANQELAGQILDALDNGNIDEFIDNLAEAKRREATGILNRMAEYAKLSLEGKTSDNPRYQAIIDNILTIDVETLTNQEKAAMVTLIDNIVINDAYYGAEQLSIIAQAQANARKALTISNVTNLRKIMSPSIAGEFLSISELFRRIFGPGKSMVQVQREMGYGDFWRAFTDWRVQMEGVAREIHDFGVKQAKAHSNFKTKEGNIAAGMFGFLAQPIRGREDSFAIAKSIIEEDIAFKLNYGEADMVKQGELAQQVYDEIFRDAVTLDQAQQNFKEAYEGNYNMWEFLTQEIFPRFSDDLRVHDEVFRGEMVDFDIPNYSPKTYKKVEAQGIETERPYLREPKTIAEVAQAAATKGRKDPMRLPKGRVIDYNLTTNSMRSLSDALYDMHTAQHVQMMKRFMETPEASTIFGGPTNMRLVINKINDMLGTQRGNLGNISDFDKLVNKAFSSVREFAAKRALGGFTQAIKQPSDVMLNTAVNVGPTHFGKGVYAMLTEYEAASDLLSKFTIGDRGGVAGGVFKRSVSYDLERIMEDIEPRSMKELIRKFGQLTDNSMLLLSKSDALAAKASWISYYSKYLSDNGSEMQDMTTESRLVEGDALRMEAALYAEAMVDRNQVESETSKMANINKLTGDVWKSILKSIFVPFSTFSMNQRTRMVTDLTDIYYRTGSERIEAMRSLLATVSGIVAFNAVRIYLVRALMNGGAQLLLGMFTNDDDDVNEQGLVALVTGVESLYGLGLMDADIYRMAKNAQREALKGEYKPKKQENVILAEELGLIVKKGMTKEEKEAVYKKQAKFKEMYSSAIKDVLVSGYPEFMQSGFIDAMNGVAYLQLSAMNDESVQKKNGELMEYGYWKKKSELTPFNRYGQWSDEFSVGLFDVVLRRTDAAMEQYDAIKDTWELSEGKDKPQKKKPTGPVKITPVKMN